MEDHKTATKIRHLGITMGHLGAIVTMVPKASMQNQELKIMSKGRKITREKAYGVEIKRRKRGCRSQQHLGKARCQVSDQDHQQLSSWWWESLRVQ